MFYKARRHYLARMKRFWAVAEVAAAGGVYTVLLDGKAVRVPEGGELALPFAPLATAIAAEWQAAPATFTPDDLPLTRLAATAQHRVPAHRAQIIADLAAYALHDLLCHRAEDPALAEEETAAWNPWLAWAARQYGVTLATGAGIATIPQPAETLPAFTAALTALPDATLAGLGVIIPALGSLILGLAVAAGALAPAAACTLAELDALWQESRWGADEDAAARRAAIAADVAVCTRFMVLCQIHPKAEA